MGCHPSKVSEKHIVPIDQKNLVEDSHLNDSFEPTMEPEKKDKSKGSHSTEKLDNERKLRFSELTKNLILIDTQNSHKDEKGSYTESFVSAVSDIAETCTSVLTLEGFSKEEKETMREDLYKSLSDSGGILVACDIIVEVLSPNQENYSEKLRSSIQLVYVSVCLIHDFTDARPDLTHQIVKNDKFMEILAVSLRDWADFDEDEIESKLEGYLRDSFLSIVHNLAMADLHTKLLRDMEFVDILVPYLDSFKHHERLTSFAALADIVNEEESEIVQRKPEMLEFILSCLGEAMNDKDRRSERASLMSTSELARIVRQVARNDTNKQALSDLEVLPLLVKLSKSDAAADQKEAALGLRTLAFDKNVQNKMVNGKDGVIERFIEMRKSSNSEVKKTANAALWTLREKMNESNKYKKLGQEFTRSNEDKITPDKKTGHIMVSYQWESQQILLKIRNSIQKAGLKVWMDVDDMEGSTLQAMAAAVENAETVLVCYSQKYKDSPNCRAEAEYAFKLKKKIIPLRMERGYVPDGWLGMIEGSKLFYDFSGKYTFEHKEQQLLKALLSNKEEAFDEVNALAKINERPKSRPANIIHRTPVVEKSMSVQRSPSSIDRIQIIRNWSTEQVLVWMNKNNLSKEKFGSLTGEEIAFLKVLSEKSPDFFFKTLDTTLDIRDLKTLARFNFALEDLPV